MTDIAIRVENLSKRYRIGMKEERQDTLVGSVLGSLRHPLRSLRRLSSLTHFDEADSPDVLWALKDVSFEVPRGEVLGVIGRNGAGKSTLLKILARITYPTHGRVELHGRVASLLEVGTGFHPELTGRENVYLNGTILGMTKPEIDRKFDEIVDFSGIEKFIDTPVKRYSSGMAVRLAFSVAAHLEPEILLVDEVLAVGDVEFQRKCLGKMGEVARGGRTILFVSHNMAAINKLCHQVFYIINGVCSHLYDPGVAIAQYLSTLENSNLMIEWPDPSKAPGDEFIRLKSVEIKSIEGKPAVKIYQDQDFIISISYLILKSMNNANIGFELNNQDGIVLLSSFDADNPEWSGRGREPGTYLTECVIKGNLLNTGTFYITVHAGIPFFKLCLREENVLKINVHMATSQENPIGRMGAKRPGWFAPNFEWKIKKTVDEDRI